MKKELKDLIYDPESVLVFDIDGVLAAYEYGALNHNACPDDDWDNYVLNNNVYETARPPKVFQELIAEKPAERIFTLSAAGQNEMDLKKRFVCENYPSIPQRNIWFVENKMEKAEKLELISFIFPTLDYKKIVMIDDTIKVLTHIQDNTQFSTIHVSSFLE